jgi:hypothetical protein
LTNAGQIHETLLDTLDIYAFATPESPPSVKSYRPYASYEYAPAGTSRAEAAAATGRGGSEPPCPYTFLLSEPDFFPSGSEYHGLVSVDHDAPSTIPKLASAAWGRPAPRPTVFFLEPLEGDVSETGNVTLTTVVHNLPIWEPADESEPAGLRRGHVAIELNGRELVRCGRRTCAVAIHGLPDGPASVRASLFGPPPFAGSGSVVRQAVSAAEVRFFICAIGVRDCSSGECQCLSSSSGDDDWDLDSRR